ncbi:MAG: DUF1289 domain-containing protein [Betaproteobacteria bacterium]|nr:DUF1289 domain-containing protein [Betaproteobacteria bacterium]
MVDSPCINVCRMDETSGLCQGCFRTLDEIALWSRLDDSQRLGVLAAIVSRRGELGATTGASRSDHYGDD